MSNSAVIKEFISGSKLPYKDSSLNSVELINVVHRVESLVELITECYRVLKKHGKLKITSPYYLSIQAWQDPRTLRAISEATFVAFSKQARESGEYDFVPKHVDFRIIKADHALQKEMMGKSQESIQYALLHVPNTSFFVNMVFEKI